MGGAGGGASSSSIGTGEPSRDRLSGVWMPLEWAERPPPVWLGDAGALLGGKARSSFRLELISRIVLQVIIHYWFITVLT